MEELKEIRRIWVVEKHEIEDNLPRIFKEIMGVSFPYEEFDDNQVFAAEEMALLQKICGEDFLTYELSRNLLDIERRFRTKNRRSGLYESLEKAIRRGFYKDEEDAVNRAKREAEARVAAQEGKYEQLSLSDLSPKP